MTMMRKSTLLGAGVAVALGVSSIGANAAILQYFGEDLNGDGNTPLASTPNASAAQASFLSGLIGVGTEDFETQSGSAPLALTFPGAGTATLTGSGSIVSVTPGTTNGVGRYGTSGSNFWEVSSGNFTINLSGPTAAFGFFGIDIGDVNEQLIITLNDAANTVINVGNSTVGGSEGSVLFFGIIGTTAADTFTQVTFSSSGNNGDVFAFDDMTIGSLQQVTVPEPAALGLFGLGLVGLGLAARRRKA